MFLILSTCLLRMYRASHYNDVNGILCKSVRMLILFITLHLSHISSQQQSLQLKTAYGSAWPTCWSRGGPTSCRPRRRSWRPRGPRRSRGRGSADTPRAGWSPPPWRWSRTRSQRWGDRWGGRGRGGAPVDAAKLTPAPWHVSRSWSRGGNVNKVCYHLC